MNHRQLIATIALLAICLATPLATGVATAQDPEPKTDLPKEWLGEWSVDIDKLIANSAELQALPKEQREAQLNMIRAMLGSMKVTIEASRIVMNMQGQEQANTFEVVRIEGNVATLVVTDQAGVPQDGTMKLIDANSMELSGKSKGNTLYLKREGGPGAVVTPAKKEPKDVPIGNWHINAKASMDLTPRPDGQTDDERAMMQRQLEQQAKVLLITFTDKTMTWEATTGGFKETHEWEVVEVVDSADGKLKIVRIRLRSNGAEEWDKGEITIVNDDTMNVVLGNESMVMERGPYKADPAPTPTGKHAAMLGRWKINVEASVRARAANAGKTEEELATEIAQAKVMAGQMTFEFTADTMFVYMGATKIPQATYKVLSTEGDVVTAEMTTIEGDLKKSTITVTEGALVIDTGDGEPLHLLPAPKEGGSGDGDE
ncbi:MAG: hypothetical protein AB7K09_17970 [Planctomycetota bacterium]